MFPSNAKGTFLFGDESTDNSDRQLDIRIIVCGLHEAEINATRGRATHAVSLLDPGTPEPDFGLSRDQHLVLNMTDTENPKLKDAPKKDQVLRFLKFTKKIPPGASLLIHCHAGMVRSPAFALAAIVQRVGGNDNELVEDILRKAVCRHHPMPNLLIARYADELMAGKGSLLSIARKTVSDSLSGTNDLIITRDEPLIVGKGLSI